MFSYLIYYTLFLVVLCIIDFVRHPSIWKDTNSYNSFVFKIVLSAIFCFLLYKCIGDPFETMVVDKEFFINRFFYWMASFIPTQDGSSISGVILNIVMGGLSLVFIWLITPALFSIPFAIIYYLFHFKRDLPSRLYEWVSIVTCVPLLLYLNLWATRALVPFADFFIGKCIYWVASCIAVFNFGGLHQRCPKCLSSDFTELSDSFTTETEEYKGYTDYYTVTEVDGKEVNREFDKREHHYDYHIKKYYHYCCDRCKHDWWG